MPDILFLSISLCPFLPNNNIHMITENSAVSLWDDNFLLVQYFTYFVAYS